MSKYLVVITLIVFLISSSFAAPKDAAKKDEEEVKATLIAMWKAIQENNIEKYASYVHPDYTCFGENDVYLTVGKDKDVKSTEIWMSQIKNIHTQMHQPMVKIVGNVAWVVYYWTESGDQSGESFSSRGKSTRILVKEKGKWLCIHGHFTAVP